MTVNSRIAPFLEVFRRTATSLESPELTARVIEINGGPEKLGLPQFIAVSALAWAPRQLRAIALLLENELALEAEPVIRSLYELAINIAWIGKDPERAEQVRDEGLAALRTWLAAMSQEVPRDLHASMLESVSGLLAQSTGKEGKLPSFVERAKRAEVPGFGPGYARRVYQFSYRRLSAAVHADSRALNLLLHMTGALEILDSQDTSVAGTILLGSAGECLGILAEVGPLASELFRVAKDSRTASP